MIDFRRGAVPDAFCRYFVIKSFFRKYGNKNIQSMGPFSGSDHRCPLSAKACMTDWDGAASTGETSAAFGTLQREARRKAAPCQSMRAIFVSSITFDHLAISALTSVRISSGVLPRTSPPVAVSRRGSKPLRSCRSDCRRGSRRVHRRSRAHPSRGLTCSRRASNWRRLLRQCSRRLPAWLLPRPVNSTFSKDRLKRCARAYRPPLRLQIRAANVSGDSDSSALPT
jgi:hypothetical protein